MTRATIRIISALQGIDFLYGVHADGYPDSMLEPLKDFDGNIASLEYQSGMDINPAGNFSYYYEINCDTRTLTYWESQIYWRNAPDDWKEQGWNCWMGKNGKYGYTNWRKGKKLGTYTYPKNITILIAANTQYPIEALLALLDVPSAPVYTLKKLFKKTKDIHVIHTYITGDAQLHKAMYEMPYSEIPLHLDDSFNLPIYQWRLKYGH